MRVVIYDILSMAIIPHYRLPYCFVICAIYYCEFHYAVWWKSPYGYSKLFKINTHKKKLIHCVAIFTILYGNYYPPRGDFKLICIGKFARRTWVNFTKHYGKNSQMCQQNTFYYASRGITQSFQNFNVIFFVDRLTSWSKFVVHNTLTIEKNNQHWLPERGSLSTDVRPILNRLYHSFICVMPILSSTKAFCIISIVSVQLLPRLKQNSMQIRWSVRSVIFNCKQMRRREKARLM